MSLPARAVGIPWYRREDYGRLRALFNDGDKLPARFEHWEQHALQVEAQVKRSGQIAVRAYLDPEQFAAWCKAQRLRPASKARIAFAAETAVHEHGQDH